MTTELSSDFDENLSTLLSMGFPDMDEIKRALKVSKNDLIEAVSILTNDGPSNSSSKRDHSDFSSSSNTTHDAKIGPENMEQDEAGFPVGNLYELETRVFQENWSIPYKREESLGKCLVGATKLAQEGKLSYSFWFTSDTPLSQLLRSYSRNHGLARTMHSLCGQDLARSLPQIALIQRHSALAN